MIVPLSRNGDQRQTKGRQQWLGFLRRPFIRGFELPRRNGGESIAQVLRNGNYVSGSWWLEYCGAWRVNKNGPQLGDWGPRRLQLSISVLGRMIIPRMGVS